jgi:cell wall-associated NlpC family hydrolase
MRVWPVTMLLVAAAAALVVLPARGDSTPAIQEKQAEAARVIAEINALDERLSVVSERYDGARYRLQALRMRLRLERRSLARARVQHRIAQQRFDAMLVNLYQAGRPSALEIVLGARTFADVLSLTDAQDRIAREDDAIAAAALRARERLRREVHALERDRAAANATVAQLRSERTTMERGLAQRRALLSSVRTQIAQLEAQERARQARLAAQARARLAAEARARELAQARAAAVARAREQARAAAREREQAAARRAAAAPAPRPATPTPTAARDPGTAQAAEEPPPAPAASPTPAGEPAAAPPPEPSPAAPAVTTSASAPAPIVTSPSPLQAPARPEAAQIAMQYLGVPYRWGGSSPSGFDCSGLVSYVYAQIGIPLPHYAAAQWTFGTPVPQDELQPGDLVFFDNLTHVGISLGGSEFVDAPHTGTVVRIDSLEDPWYASRYVGARRL